MVEQQNTPQTKIEEVRARLESWQPKTKLGRLVKEGKITSIDYILSHGYKILEPEIVDWLLPNLKVEYIRLGMSKGKFRRPRALKMVQKTSAEGKKTKFLAMVVVGDENGHVGIGIGKSNENSVAIQKAIRKAKLNIISVLRGCGSWECACGEPHSVPFRVEGKMGSVRVVLLPAPRGVGLVASDEAKKILRLAGYKDVWMQSFGQTRRRINHIGAIYDALKKLSKVRVNSRYAALSGLKVGEI